LTACQRDWKQQLELQQLGSVQLPLVSELLEQLFLSWKRSRKTTTIGSSCYCSDWWLQLLLFCYFAVMCNRKNTFAPAQMYLQR
jgi:hypothetical protein